MSESQQYRAQARSFERQAAEAQRQEARDDYLKLAALWNRLADESEVSERAAGPAHKGARRNSSG
ncbi:MAG: hypothetical protein P4L64_00065 [Caulobacteraceae bacterium]|nr:hypothetical protein [Caulobacteraceae bacterium]